MFLSSVITVSSFTGRISLSSIFTSLSVISVSGKGTAFPLSSVKTFSFCPSRFTTISGSMVSVSVTSVISANISRTASSGRFSSSDSSSETAPTSPSTVFTFSSMIRLTESSSPRSSVTRGINPLGSVRSVITRERVSIALSISSSVISKASFKTFFTFFSNSSTASLNSSSDGMSFFSSFCSFTGFFFVS